MSQRYQLLNISLSLCRHICDWARGMGRPSTSWTLTYVTHLSINDLVSTSLSTSAFSTTSCLSLSSILRESHVSSFGLGDSDRMYSLVRFELANSRATDVQIYVEGGRKVVVLARLWLHNLDCELRMVVFVVGQLMVCYEREYRWLCFES